MLKIMKRVGIAILILALGVAALPWGLYAFALGNINGRPVPPERIILAESESREIWVELKEVEPIEVEKLTPYRYVEFLLGMGENKQKPGERLAWFVARNYNSEHLEKKRMLYWHFSGTALTIWLTRNWSAEQLLAKAKEIMEKKNEASNNRVEFGLPASDLGDATRPSAAHPER